MEIKLTAADSAVVRNYYSGNYSKYKIFRQSLVLANIANASWERTSFYLNIDTSESRRFATKIKIDSPYYLLAFMQDSIIEHPYKKKLILKIRNAYISLSKDKNASNYSNAKLLNSYFSLRMKNRIVKYHEIKEKFNQTINKAVIEEVFHVDVDSFMLKKGINFDVLKETIKSPSSHKNLFREFVEISKKHQSNHTLSNSSYIQFYYKQIHNYCFNQAGGYQL